MAGRGPAPKPAGQRARARNERRAEEAITELDVAAAPKKTRPLPGAKARHPRTRRWWKIAARTPQASLFTESDWLVMERLADLYDSFFGGALERASEIRLVEAKLGFTPEDRLRLRWRLASTPGDDEGPAALSAAERQSGGPEVDPRLRYVKGGAA